MAETTPTGTVLPHPPTEPSNPPPMEIQISDTAMEDPPPQAPSFKEILTDKSSLLKNCYNINSNSFLPNTTAAEEPIFFMQEEKERIYAPWFRSVIVKVSEKKVSHQFLQEKLIELWQPNKPLILIDLGYNYFIVKFTREKKHKQGLA